MSGEIMKKKKRGLLKTFNYQEKTAEGYNNTNFSL